MWASALLSNDEKESDSMKPYINQLIQAKQ